MPFTPNLNVGGHEIVRDPKQTSQPSGASPRADRRHLQQIIARLSEGVIVLDPDRTIVWANETALAIHGVTQLAQLGHTADDYCKLFRLKYRNNHLLKPKQYPIRRVLAGDTFQDLVVQISKPNDDDFHGVHAISSLVLADSQDRPESLVLMIQDATERYEAEDRFERTFNANPAPALICSLADLRYVKVNQGFQDMTGYGKESVIGRTVYEIDVFYQSEQKDQAIANLNEGKTIPQMEAELKLRGGQSKPVIVAGQPIDVDGDPCMLFTFIDLEPRKKIEVELREMQERFSMAFRLAPVPMTVSTLNGFRLLEVNDAFTQTSGYPPDEIVARDAASLPLWADPGAYQQLETKLKLTGSIRNHEIQLRTKDGAILDCLVSAERVAIHDEDCVLGVLQDITERKRSEVELIAAIEAVMQDTSWFSRTVIDKLAQIRQPDAARPGQGVANLTPREKEVLGLLCQGNSDQEIADTLYLSRNTVRNHVSTLYSKIGVNRRSAAIVWGRERGIIGYEKPKRRPS